MEVQFYDPAYEAWVKMYSHSSIGNCESYIQKRQGGQMDMLARIDTGYRKNGLKYYNGGTLIGNSEQPDGLDLPAVKRVADFYPRDKQYEAGLYWVEIFDIPGFRSSSKPTRKPALSPVSKARKPLRVSYEEVARKLAKRQTDGYQGRWAAVRRVDNSAIVAAFCEGREVHPPQLAEDEYNRSLLGYEEAQKAFIPIDANGWQGDNLQILRSIRTTRGDITSLDDVSKGLHKLVEDMRYIGKYAQMSETQWVVWEAAIQHVYDAATALHQAALPVEDRTNG